MIFRKNCSGPRSHPSTVSAGRRWIVNFVHKFFIWNSQIVHSRQYPNLWTKYERLSTHSYFVHSLQCNFKMLHIVAFITQIVVYAIFYNTKCGICHIAQIYLIWFVQNVELKLFFKNPWQVFKNMVYYNYSKGQGKVKSGNSRDGNS